MKRSMLTVSPLVIAALSGCTTETTVPGDANSSIQTGTAETNDGRTDWLSAWWKKAVPDPVQRGVDSLGLSRWFSARPEAKGEDGAVEGEGKISLWDTVGGRVSLADRNQPKIQKAATFYAHNSRFLDRLSDQAGPYFDYVLGEVQRRNMPVEVALLPVIESAYEPGATSPRNAAGLWQMIPGTARRWGLGLSRNYDGRRDVYASTRAALDYLQKLNDDFNGDWLLTLAAYNCGELNVSHAIERNQARGKATDFWSLNLPAETRAFVPRILGLATLIAEPQTYGIQLKALHESPVTSVKVDYQLDLSRVALLADVPLEEVRRLNPAYRRGKTDLNGGNLLLPSGQAHVFEERLAALDPSEIAPVQTATDAPPMGASKRDKEDDDDAPRKAAAPRTASHDDDDDDDDEPVRKGAASRTAAHDDDDDDDDDQAARKATTTHTTTQAHVVRKGDTLEGLAHKAGVTVKELLAWNHLKPRAALQIGQRLTVRKVVVVAAAPKGHNAVSHSHGHGRVKASMLAQGKHHGSHHQKSAGGKHQRGKPAHHPPKARAHRAHS